MGMAASQKGAHFVEHGDAPAVSHALHRGRLSLRRTLQLQLLREPGAVLMSQTVSLANGTKEVQTGCLFAQCFLIARYGEGSRGPSVVL